MLFSLSLCLEKYIESPLRLIVHLGALWIVIVAIAI